MPPPPLPRCLHLDKVMCPEAESVGAKFVKTVVGGNMVEEEEVFCLSKVAWEVLCAFASVGCSLQRIC